MYMISCGHGHIRGALAVIASLVLALALASPACAQEAFISVNGGMFKQSSDYSDDYDTGLAAALSYILVNENTGFEFGLNGYTSTNDLLEVDVTGLGLEVLVHFHTTDSVLRPFIALGVSRYKTTIESPFSEDTYSGGGGVLKVGARLFLGPRVFIGAYYKKLTNDVDIGGFRYNLGGDFIFGELGIVTF
jgi:hypothetical protein